MKNLMMAVTAAAFLQGCSTSLFMEAEDIALRDKIMSQMVHVAGGDYELGESCEEDATACPATTVAVSSFYISKFEMTQDIFFDVVGNDVSYFRGDNMPVNHVTWQQVQYFIEQLNKRTGKNFRLPTEAEWEFAAKGGNQSQGLRFSGSNNIDDVAWYKGNAKNKAHSVGSKLPNELGLYDMTGNVGEWVQDAYEAGYNRFESLSDPINDIDSEHHLAYKSVRGGSFSYPPESSKNTSRDFASQTAMMADIGFRLVLSEE
ncbi:formylglycine-generating enzyme family protein [Vibrio hepatarius]|uniref:formylglycine-generating enzyme family protein n=1 Tax=Vibrio hepatarius TaxID=171383 RepID=UPI00373704B4